MASNFAFVPQGICYNVTATAGTASVTITVAGPAITTGQMPATGMRLANLGTAVVFVQFGVPGTAAPTVAVSTGMPIFANTIETFQFKGQNAMAFTSVGTTTLYVQPGEGL